MADSKIKCCLCKREIVGLYVHVYKDGKYLPAHRDCRTGTTAKGRAVRKPKKPRCHETKALKKYRAAHEGAESQ